IYRFRKRNCAPLPRLKVQDPQTIQRLRLLHRHRKVSKQVNVFDENILVVRDENLPIFRIVIIFRRSENLKIPCVLVASNVEEIFAMIYEVAAMPFARKKKDERGLRLISPQIPELCSIGAKGPKQYVFLVSGLVHSQPESLVLLFIQ